MRNTLIVCTIALLAAPAAGYAATGIGGGDRMKVVNHVRHREKRNAFHLRERIGGAFYLGGVNCDRSKPGPVLRCSYEAREIGTDAAGKRTACTINVKVTRRSATRTRWHRSVKVCATSFAPPPPTG